MKSVIPLLLILKGIESQSPEEIAAALAKKAMEDRVFLERKMFNKNSSFEKNLKNFVKIFVIFERKMGK